MNYCTGCGSRLRENACFCAYCGTPTRRNVDEGRDRVSMPENYKVNKVSPPNITVMAISGVAVVVVIALLVAFAAGVLPINIDSSGGPTGTPWDAESASQWDGIIPTVGQTFVDNGVLWRVLHTESGYSLLITQHVHGVGTRYHSENIFIPFEDAEIFDVVITWYNENTSARLRDLALPYGYQRNNRDFGGNGVENQAMWWRYTPRSMNFREARTIPDENGDNYAFILSLSETNEYFADTPAARQAFDVNGFARHWLQRSPSTESDTPVRIVYYDGGSLGINAVNATGQGGFRVSLRDVGFRVALWVSNSTE